MNGVAYAFFGSSDGFIYAVDMEGNNLDGWPIEIGESVDNSVSFADLDGDGEPEAIIGITGKVYVYHMDGTLYDRFPISYEVSLTSAPLIADLDGDKSWVFFGWKPEYKALYHKQKEEFYNGKKEVSNSCFTSWNCSLSLA